MMRQILFGVGLLLLFLITPAVLAQDPVSPIEAMAVGNQNYEAGQYTQASQIYESIVAAGVRDSVLYYNLANSYFKQGDLGRAILNYRRAHRLNPRDNDIRTNLAVARSQTLDKLEVEGEGSLTNAVQVAEDWLTINEASILALMLWLLVSGCLIVAILWPRFRRLCLWTASVLGVFLIAGLISMANRLYTDWSYSSAVIVAPEVDVTSGPGTAEQYLVEFNLHTGAEVKIIESRPGWRRVALPGNDFQGWVPEEAIEPVVVD
jgi:tetratricopeptide (TPR) repeat protein